MYWALTTDLVDTRGFRFEQVLADIQTLNQWARAARLEVTAISLAAYPFVQQDYALLPHGASIGSGYGPVVVAREPLALDELQGIEIVVPGALTTAYPRPPARARRDRGPRAAVRADPRRGGERPCGRRAPHPRGAADVRRARPLEGARPRRVVAARDGAAAAARRERRAPRRRAAARPLGGAPRGDHLRARQPRRRRSTTRCSSGEGSTRRSPTGSSRMYVNELTKDYGDEGRTAVAELLRRGEAIGALPGPVSVDWIA